VFYILATDGITKLIVWRNVSDAITRLNVKNSSFFNSLLLTLFLCHGIFHALFIVQMFYLGA
jgi:hypothetical protein